MTPAASVRASEANGSRTAAPFHPELPRSDQRQHCAGGDGRARNPQAARRPTYLRAPLGFGGAPDARQRLGRKRRHLQVAAQDFFVVDVAHVTSPTGGMLLLPLGAKCLARPDQLRLGSAFRNLQHACDLRNCEFVPKPEFEYARVV